MRIKHMIDRAPELLAIALVLGVAISIGYTYANPSPDRFQRGRYVSDYIMVEHGDCRAPRGTNEWTDRILVINPDTSTLEMVCKRYIGNHPLPGPIRKRHAS